MARNLSIRTDSPEVIPDTRPYGCYEGWVYLGFEGEDENGEYAEVIERVSLAHKVAKSGYFLGRSVNCPKSRLNP